MSLAAHTLAFIFLTEPDQPQSGQQETAVSILMAEVQLCHLCFAD